MNRLYRSLPYQRSLTFISGSRPGMQSLAPPKDHIIEKQWNLEESWKRADLPGILLSTRR